VIAAVAIFAAVGQWNSWTDNLYLAPDLKLQTLQLLLYNYMSEQTAMAVVRDVNAMRAIRVTPTSIRMTITMVTILPILFVYPFLQRYFLKGLMLGAVKG
jgi:ABC-type glycerol-3-phosphate transport system permease component